MKNSILILSLLSFLSATAQLNEGGTPLSFTIPGISASFHHISLEPHDLKTLVQQDEEAAKIYRSERFASLVPVGVNPLNSGTWEETEWGSRIWRLKLSLEGSFGSSLYFTEFKLPENVSMFVYNQEGTEITGAFTARNNRENGLFATALIPGGNVVVELNAPSPQTPGNWFTISEITFSYSGLGDPLQSRGFGGSQFCEVNINCSPEGDDWQDEKRGVARIQVKVNGAAFWCSGTLVNNTSMDKTPYFLTADHCAFKFGQYATAEDLGNWIFYFNYESAGCDDPQSEPQLLSLTGCEKIAQDGTHGMEGSDFYLVKLLDEIPGSYHVYFNGWSAVDTPASGGVTIHHPDGDIKKISTFLEPLVSTGWQGNGLPSHWEVIWAETVNNWGVTEGGSSGAPLFDDLGRVVGTLTGGLASCDNQELPDYYGKFSFHWESNGTPDTLQLKPWLDPGNTGLISLGGLTMGFHPSEAGILDEMNVFPNPAVSVLKISFGKPTFESFTLEIVNLLGQVVASENIPVYTNSTELRVDHLNPGLYFIRKAGHDHPLIRKMMKR